MAVAASARRYAQAVFNLALEQNALDRWLADLTTLAQLAEDPSFLSVMASPRVNLEKKLEIMQERLTAASPLAQNLAKLLVVKGRVEVIPGLLEAYRRMADDHHGVVHARVTTAVPLEPAEQAALGQQLARFTGKQVVLTTDVDPSIIGGLIARIGDKLLDGSSKARLQALRRQLAMAR